VSIIMSQQMKRNETKRNEKEKKRKEKKRKEKEQPPTASTTTEASDSNMASTNNDTSNKANNDDADNKNNNDNNNNNNNNNSNNNNNNNAAPQQGNDQMDEEGDNAMMLDQDDVDEVIDSGNNVDELQHGIETHANVNDGEADDAENDTEMDDDQPQEPIKDCSRTTFSGHKGYVLTTAWHPDGVTVASGGEDDKAFVWKASDGSQLLQIDGHKDSVIGVAFNRDGSLIASASMDGMILVKKTADGSKVCELDCGDDLTWFQWHPVAQFIIAATDSGSVYMWDVPGANMSFFSGHGQTVTCGSWSPEGRNFATGGEDGALILWSPKTGAAIAKLEGKADHKFHKTALTSLTWNTAGDLCATGGADGSVCISQPKAGKVVASLQAGPQPIEAVAFSSTTPQLLAVADLGGLLYIFDIHSQRCLHRLQHNEGVIKIVWEKGQQNIVCATLDGKVHHWDCVGGKRIKELTGHVGQILDFSVTKDFKQVVSVGQDQKCLIYDL